uniref:Uncharacterized protein LOC105637916 isoform X2 n=1 Tax=Rhizophora mucronata TaxID=61149 RepID=A0A2P2LBY1_RHIMU
MNWMRRLHRMSKRCQPWACHLERISLLLGKILEMAYEGRGGLGGALPQQGLLCQWQLRSLAMQEQQSNLEVLDLVLIKMKVSRVVLQLENFLIARHTHAKSTQQSMQLQTCLLDQMTDRSNCWLLQMLLLILLMLFWANFGGKWRTTLVLYLMWT